MTCRDDPETFSRCPVSIHCKKWQQIGDMAADTLYADSGLVTTTMQSIENMEAAIDPATMSIDQIAESRSSIEQVKHGLAMMMGSADVMRQPDFDLDRVRSAGIGEPMIDELGRISCCSLAINEDERSSTAIVPKNPPAVS